MHKTGSSVEWFFNPNLDGWTFHFPSSGKKIHISREFIHDWKYSMGDLVYEIEKMHNLTLDEAAILHSVLYAEQKKALFSFAYGQKLSPQLKSLFPKKDLEPRPRVLYLVDLGEGMLVPRSFIQDFIAWDKDRNEEQAIPYEEPYYTTASELMKLKAPKGIVDAQIYALKIFKSPYPNSDT